MFTTLLTYLFLLPITPLLLIICCSRRKSTIPKRMKPINSNLTTPRDNSSSRQQTAIDKSINPVQKKDSLATLTIAPSTSRLQRESSLAKSETMSLLDNDYNNQDDADVTQMESEQQEEQVSEKQYAQELQHSMKPNLKGPDDTISTYIKGPFSPYNMFKFRFMKNRSADNFNKLIGFSRTSSTSKPSPSKQSTPGKEQTKCEWSETVAARDIPRDQLRPHRLRKDRQIKNPNRKIQIQNKIKEIGGFCKSKVQGKFILYAPGGRVLREVTIDSDNIVQQQQPADVNSVNNQR